MQSYSNSAFSEYISCQIIDRLGLNVQKTLISTYTDRALNKSYSALACKDFCNFNKILYDFGSIKNSYIDSRTSTSKLIDDIYTLVTELQL